MNRNYIIVLLSVVFIFAGSACTSKKENKASGTPSCGSNPIDITDVKGVISESDLPDGDYKYVEAKIFVEASASDQTVKTHLREFVVGKDPETGKSTTDSEFLCATFNKNVSYVEAKAPAPVFFDKRSSKGITYARMRRFGVSYRNSKFDFEAKGDEILNSTALSAKDRMKAFYRQYDYNWYQLENDKYELRASTEMNGVEVSIAVIYEREGLNGSSSGMGTGDSSGSNGNGSTIGSNFSQRGTLHPRQDEAKAIPAIESGGLIMITIANSFLDNLEVPESASVVVQAGKLVTTVNSAEASCVITLGSDVEAKLTRNKIIYSLEIDKVIVDGSTGLTTLKPKDTGLIDKIECQTPSSKKITEAEFIAVIGDSVTVLVPPSDI